MKAATFRLRLFFVNGIVKDFSEPEFFLVYLSRPSPPVNVILVLIFADKLVSRLLRTVFFWYIFLKKLTD